MPDRAYCVESSRQLDRDHQWSTQSRAPVPAFNVFEPFQGSTIVAMNEAMVSMLVNFINEVDDDEDTDIFMLGNALSRHRSDDSDFEPDRNAAQRFASDMGYFGVGECNNVVTITLSQRVSDKLQTLIDNYKVERELVAFRRALQDPEQSREIRSNKLRQRQQEYETESV